VPWSTRQLAELAGTTVKTVRHYHSLGLLEVPARTSNGYKQYDAGHLVRLLQIRRLSDLGVSLAQIASMGAEDAEPGEALRAIDEEIAANIERLRAVRAEIASIVLHDSPTDLPAGFSEGVAELSDADRSILLIYSRLFSSTAMEDLREMVMDRHRTPVDAEFDALPADADDETKQALAERYAPHLLGVIERHPWLKDPLAHASTSAALTGSVIGEAVDALYNAAQIDVLARSHRIIADQG
jgi:DNA-binding transcriptional MerR regulator